MIKAYELHNSKGSSVKFLNYGGSVNQINVPDRYGNIGNVVLGFSDPKDYCKPHPYFGSIIGRYGGRIANARFMLDGVEYQLSANNGKNSLAGGFKGFDKVLWDVEVSEQSACLTYMSADGEEGYPGNLKTVATYTLTDNDEFCITYEATTDKPTILNLTNHTYFNLAGDGSGSIEEHILTIYSDKVLEVDAELIPTGKILSVEGTPLDFQRAMPIGARIRSNHPLIQHARGYDHSYIIDQKENINSIARVYEPKTGRTMEVFTSEPSIAFYTGNFLDSTLTGASGKQYRQGDAFTLEPRHLPDSPNHSNFPSTVLRPGDVFKSTTIYRFTADGDF